MVGWGGVLEAAPLRPSGTSNVSRVPSSVTEELRLGGLGLRVLGRWGEDSVLLGTESGARGPGSSRFRLGKGRDGSLLS